MSQWRQLNDIVTHMPDISDRLTRILLQAHLPYLVRANFAEWIETQPWFDINVEGLDAHQEGENLLKALILQIKQKEELEPNLMTKCQWNHDRQKLEVHFSNNCLEFISAMRLCLSHEKVLIESCYSDDDVELTRKRPLPNNMAQENFQINEKLSSIEIGLEQLHTSVRLLDEHQDQFLISYKDCNERLINIKKQLGGTPANQNNSDLQKTGRQLETEINKMTITNHQERMKIRDDSIKVATELALLLKNMVWPEIAAFQNEQKLHITTLNKPKNGALDILDRMCERASKLLLKMMQNLENALGCYEKLQYTDDKQRTDLAKARDELENDYIKEHLQKCFVVSKNVPNQIQKVSSGKSSTFPMQVRLLGGNGLSLSVPPKVSANIYFEKQLKEIVANPAGQLPKASGMVVNGNNKVMDMGGKSRAIANFTSIKLEKVQRPDRGKNDELVTEQKYGFVFTTEIKVREKSYPLRTISLPVILVSQTSQECMAKGTLIWDAAFSEPTRPPFVSPASAKWGEVARLLNSLFADQTGRELTQDHMQYLAQMAFRERSASDMTDRNITEKQLIKDKMVTSRDSKTDSFSFWKWFWANLNLCRDRINMEWKDGMVWGFISKEEARQKLIDRPIGTFLLRFSETSIEPSQKADFCGNITVAVVELDPGAGRKTVVFTKDHLEPKDIMEKSLAPLLEAFEVEDYAFPGKKKQLLHFLYPDNETPFEKKFHKYLKIKEEKQDGYVKGRYKVEIFLFENRRERRDSQMSVMSPPGAPASPGQQSYSNIASPGSICTDQGFPLSPGSDTSHDMDTQPLQLLTPSARPTALISPLQPNQMLSSSDLDPNNFQISDTGQSLPGINNLMNQRFQVSEDMGDMLNTLPMEGISDVILSMEAAES